MIGADLHPGQAAIGGYAINDAVSRALSATGLDQQVSKLITLVGSTGLSILSSSSVTEEMSVAQIAGSDESGLLVEASSTILGMVASSCDAIPNSRFLHWLFGIVSPELLRRGGNASFLHGSTDRMFHGFA